MTLRRLLRALGRRRAESAVAAERAASAARALSRLQRALVIARLGDKVPAAEWRLMKWTSLLAVADLEALGLGDRAELYIAAAESMP